MTWGLARLLPHRHDRLLEVGQFSVEDVADGSIRVARLADVNG